MIFIYEYKRSMNYFFVQGAIRQSKRLLATITIYIFEIWNTYSILVPRGAIPGSLEGTRQLFTQVNEFFKAKEMPPLFKVQLAGLSKQTLLAGGLYTINTDATLKDKKKLTL